MKLNKGQTSIEYILLLSVVVSIVFAVFKSRYFADFFGPESAVFERVKVTIEYSYRHGLGGRRSTPKAGRGLYSNGRHDSYGNQGRSRFFVVKSYPE